MYKQVKNNMVCTATFYFFLICKLWSSQDLNFKLCTNWYLFNKKQIDNGGNILFWEEKLNPIKMLFRSRMNKFNKLKKEEAGHTCNSSFSLEAFHCRNCSASCFILCCNWTCNIIQVITERVYIKCVYNHEFEEIQ